MHKHVCGERPCLQDFAELLHDVDDRAVARPIDLTEDGPQLLHRLGSGLQLLAGDPGLMQHLHKADMEQSRDYGDQIDRPWSIGQRIDDVLNQT